MKNNWRILLLFALAVAGIITLFVIPPIRQDPSYHDFADSRQILGIPNFWNVISNAGFIAAAILGFFRMGRFVEPWERVAHLVLLTGLGVVAFGSGYYHLHPSNDTLFWDRLPMTIVFMSLLAITIGERIHGPAGRLLLFPLLLAGAASLSSWKFTGDLRAYGFVQFYPMLALLVMLIVFPARYSGTPWIWAVIGCYALAKLLEFADRSIWNLAAPLTGHPWKHIAGGAAMFIYVELIHRRQQFPLETDA